LDFSHLQALKSRALVLSILTMGRLIHICVMRLYSWAIGLAAATGNAKARGWLAMRQGNLDRVEKATQTLMGGEKWVWFHCASVGEFEQAQPVMKALRDHNDARSVTRDLRFMLTFYSFSGWERFANHQPEWWKELDAVAALPLDTASNVRAFLKALTPPGASHPAMHFLALSKYEVWPELIRQVSPEASVALFAGHVIPGRWPFRYWGGYHREAWQQLSKVLVQSDASVAELARWGIAAKAMGDPRFDRVLEAEKVLGDPSISPMRQWVGDRDCLVVGSGWDPEFRIAQKSWVPGRACIVVPHEWDEHWAKRQQAEWKERGADAIIWSEILGSDAQRAVSFPEADVILLDAMGQLMHAYGAGGLALVGGGFGKGVHNTLEPAAHGVAIWTGPEVGRFAEVQGLQECGALVVASSESDCAEELASSWGDSQRYQKMGASAQNFVNGHAGSGSRIASELQQFLRP
jgi:3-deoxy-D-manno-octulosonic-acid transferase